MSNLNGDRSIAPETLQILKHKDSINSSNPLELQNNINKKNKNPRNYWVQFHDFKRRKKARKGLNSYL